MAAAVALVVAAAVVVVILVEMVLVINLDNQDPECDLDYTANDPRDAKLKTVISNSFGFGGTNGSLVFRAFD